MALTANFGSPANTPRTQSFRPRRVTLTLERALPQIAAIPGEIPAVATIQTFATARTVTLTEVTGVKQRFEGRPGVAQGAVDSIIQLWYMSPIRVEITGQSYIGAFRDKKFNDALTDDDIERLMLFRDDINRAFRQSAESNDLRVILEYGDTNPSESNLLERGVAQRLIGVIDDISIDENPTRPYMKTYTIRFTARDFARSDFIDIGAANQSSDKTILGLFKSGIRALKKPYIRRLPGRLIAVLKKI